MNKDIKDIRKSGLLCTSLNFSVLIRIYKADVIKFTSAFLFQNRELKSILPDLILSRLNQKLTIQPNNLLHAQSCNVQRVTTGTAYLYSVCNNETMQGFI